MIEIFLVAISALSTLVVIVFLCVQNNNNVKANVLKNKCSQQNDLENEPRKGIKRKCKQNQKKTGTNSAKAKQTIQNKSDIEKGLPNSTDSYSPQRAEIDKDSTTSLLGSTHNDTLPNNQSSPTQQESIVYANPYIQPKGNLKELPLPLPPRIQIINPVDHHLHRSQSDVEKSIKPQMNITQSKNNLQTQEHPIENSVSKRSLIPLPSTPDETNLCISQQKSSPVCYSVLKRGKSQGNLDVGSENIDLGYEALTMDRNMYKKRHQAEIMKDISIQENYARPKHYAQLKINSLHGSLSDFTPPNSARTTKSFDFLQKNSKNRRGRSIPTNPESSPFHPSRSPNSASPHNTALLPIENTAPNQYASELKPILSVLISNMNRQLTDDSVSPVDELDCSPNHRSISPAVSESHENSLYNLNGIQSILSSQGTRTSDGSRISNISKKRYTNASSSSEGNYSSHENCLYESIEDDFTMLGNASLTKSYSPDSRIAMIGQLADRNSCVFASELERSDSGKQDSAYYDSITLARIEDSDESNATSGRSVDSAYGKFIQKPGPIEGCENYDTLTHFPNSFSKLDKWNSSPDLDVPPNSRSHFKKPAHMEQHQYDCLSEGEDEAFKPNLSGRTRSIHDYEKINEDDLLKFKPEPVHREIGPF